MLTREHRFSGFLVGRKVELNGFEGDQRVIEKARGYFGVQLQSDVLQEIDVT
jgi:hypothetical protein